MREYIAHSQQRHKSKIVIFQDIIIFGNFGNKVGLVPPFKAQEGLVRF